MNRIRALRKQSGITQNKLCAKLSISQPTLSGWENGKFEPDQKAIFTMCEIFDVSSDYLLGRDDTEYHYNAPPAPTTDHSKWVPVYGAIAAGVPIESIEDIADYEEIDTNQLHGEIFGLRVKGHSMEPRICDGDIVLIRKQDTVESGEIAAVMVNGDEATLKKIKKSIDGIMLIPLNPSYETMFYNNEEILSKPIRIIGKMVELRGKF